MDSNTEDIVKDKDMGSPYGSKVIINNQKIKLEPTKVMQVITNGPVPPPREDLEKAKLDGIQTRVMTILKDKIPPVVTNTDATAEPSVVSNLTDDNKPNTTKVGTSTGTEGSTNGTVLAVSPMASQTAQNPAGTVTSTGRGGSTKEAILEASLTVSNASNSTEEAVLDTSIADDNATKNPTEYGLNCPNSSTHNQPIAGSQVN